MGRKHSLEFTELKTLSTSIRTLSSVLSLLHWDQETYMPSGGITARGEQMAQISGLIHEMKTSKKYENALKKLVSLSSGKPTKKGLSRIEKLILREWHKDYQRFSKLPTAFVKNFTQTTSQASQIWKTAKQNNDFKLYSPFLEKIIGLCQEKASIYGYEEHPYDALLESYEPSLRSSKVKEIFSKLRKNLTTLLEEIKERPKINDSFLVGEFDRQKQMDLGSLILAELPMEADYTRLDLSAHPFSLSLHPHDCRLTTRIHSDNFMSNLFSVLHEAGHTMYEMNLPVKYFGTPLAEAISLGVHESQSRWWETLIGRSYPFWQFLYPLIQDTFPEKLKKINLKRFYHAINRVAPSCIRVEADEVTYCLHIILRFEIEIALITGDLHVSDLPYAWNDKMKDLLGIIPKSDREGCLQDVHWAFGDFGYFPTYALGNIYAAQIFQTFTKKHSDWENRVANGDLPFIRDFLKKNVHSVGRQYSSEGLIQKITNHPISEKPYCNYLRKKYSDIYGL